MMRMSLRTIAYCTNFSLENKHLVCLGNEQAKRQNYHSDSDVGTTKVDPYWEGLKGPNDTNFKIAIY